MKIKRARCQKFEVAVIGLLGPILLLIQAAPLAFAAEPEAIRVALRPKSVTIPGPGWTKTLEIVAGGVQGLQGFQLKLGFDPAVVHVRAPAQLNEAFSLPVRNQADNVTGAAEFAAAGFEPLSGDVVLARLEVVGAFFGRTAVTLNDLVLSDLRGREIRSVPESGVVRVGMAARPDFTLSVSKGGSGTGRVTSEPAGIDCGSVCEADFEAGTAVQLAAKPGEDSRFVGWSGNCRGRGDCVIRLGGERSVTAEFEPLAQE